MIGVHLDDLITRDFGDSSEGGWKLLLIVAPVKEAMEVHCRMTEMEEKEWGRGNHIKLIRSSHNKISESR